MDEKEKCCHDHHAHDEAHTHDFGADHAHTHEGGCGHGHEHSHDGHTHDHDGHTHSHDGHTHSHGTGAGTPAEVIALLTYMADHNEHHAAELADMGEKLRGLGKTEAADKIAEGVAEFAKANAKLAEALKLVKEL